MATMEYFQKVLPLLIVALALVVWLVIHRRYKRNIRSTGGGLLGREKELDLVERSSLLTPEERRRIRVTIAMKMKEAEGDETRAGPKLPIDIRDLEDKHPSEDP